MTEDKTKAEIEQYCKENGLDDLIKKAALAKTKYDFSNNEAIKYVVLEARRSKNGFVKTKK